MKWLVIALSAWVLAFAIGFSLGKHRSPTLAGFLKREARLSYEPAETGSALRVGNDLVPLPKNFLNYRLVCGEHVIRYQALPSGGDTVIPGLNPDYRKPVPYATAGAGLGAILAFITDWIFDLKSLSRTFFADFAQYSPKDWRVITVVAAGTILGAGAGYVAGYAEPVDCGNDKDVAKLKDPSLWRMVSEGVDRWRLGAPPPR